MRWKQFLTPVQSFNADQAKEYIAKASHDEFTLLDVRLPEEYEDEHIPGATLIPLSELTDRLDEIPKDKTIIVY